MSIVDVTSVLDGTVGDFDGDGQWTCDDIDHLAANIAAGSGNRDLDMDGDGTLAANDISRWLTTAGGKNLGEGMSYHLGDANLDGIVNGADFTIWNQNKFSSQAAFCSGDFNGDGEIDGYDFLLWNRSRLDTNAADPIVGVPEPTVAGWLFLLGFVVARRVRCAAA